GEGMFWLILGLAVVGPVIAQVWIYRSANRLWKSRLSSEAEESGLLVVDIERADFKPHPFPKFRVTMGAPQVRVFGAHRGATRHFRLRVFNAQEIEQEIWARVETSPLAGPAVIEWRPPIGEVARAIETIEPLRESGFKSERTKFGPFAKR
ncbi:MAG: hypothetical protein K8E66_03140, partial [Phycisphaerales bacterium]|nr:hypothetical protein [Phycisphaerales bacterium]